MTWPRYVLPALICCLLLAPVPALASEAPSAPSDFVLASASGPDVLPADPFVESGVVTTTASGVCVHCGNIYDACVGQKNNSPCLQTGCRCRNCDGIFECYSSW